MADYEHMSISEVQRLAKQGDSDALFEMAWRMDVMPEIIGNPVEECAWQDYWFEKAADAGNIDAKGRYARSLMDRIMNAEDRKKAEKYFKELVDDLDAGRLISDDEKENGGVAKVRLGIMLCEGYYTQRDAVKGCKITE
jgi:hypothetical protein